MGRPVRIGSEHATVVYIHEHREAKGLTQEQLADRLGVSKSAISRWEAKPRKARAQRRLPDINVLAAVAEALGIPTEALFRPPNTNERETRLAAQLERLPPAARDEAIAYVEFIIRRHSQN